MTKRYTLGAGMAILIVAATASFLYAQPMRHHGGADGRWRPRFRFPFASRSIMASAMWKWFVSATAVIWSASMAERIDSSSTNSAATGFVSARLA